MSTVMGVQLPPILDDRDEQQWLDRSKATAAMWTLFVAEYMEWLRSGECGNWQVTGAGQAWSHWRHGYYTHKVLVHSDDAALAAEREAMYTGRAEMLWWGRDLSMPAFEWDWQSAYLRLARDCELPTELVCSVPSMSIRDYRYLAGKYAVLAHVTVTTTVPVAPTRTSEGILWPVGTYRSALWDPEITALLAAGATVVIGQAWLYRKAPALQQWADGMLKAVLIPASHTQQWKKYVAKHWGRALVGRFAARYQEWEEIGKLPWPDVTIGTWIDRDTGEVRDTAQIGDVLYLSDGYTEAAHSAPQITSYVMSLARVKLWNALCDIGMENVLYVNTDSLVTTANGRRRLLARIAEGDLAGLVQKHAARGVEIYGHQSAIVGDTTKLAGCPTGSLRQTETTWMGECWSSLDHAVKTGELDKVTISRRRYTVRYSETRRRRLPGGRTAPWEVEISDTGSTVRSGPKISHRTAADDPDARGR